MQILIKRVPNEEGQFVDIPRYMSQGAAAFDLTANISKEIKILPNEKVLIPTGICIELPNAQYAAFVYARSGLATKYGISLSNGVGVIDSDYRGEIKVGLINTSTDDFILKRGERIAQLCVQPVFVCEIIEKEELSNTVRGSGGFGSTGKM